MLLKQHKLKSYLNWKLDFVTASDFGSTIIMILDTDQKEMFSKVVTPRIWGEARDAMPLGDRRLITDDVQGKQLIAS